MSDGLSESAAGDGAADGAVPRCRAENRRLRREAGDREALKRIRSDSGEGRTFTREGLAEAWGVSE